MTTDGEGDHTTTSLEVSVTLKTTAESPSTIDITTSATGVVSETAIPSAINGNNPGNSIEVTSPTIADGQLPLEPRLTPGAGVSGAILIITGIVYALIGIKNGWLHTFFSTAYLASLSVTVLIVYILVPPISDAIQGAYVVAAVCTGLILGGVATVFRELTEGLGCLLGGFCFAMWLLTLRAGGLLPETSGKVILITVFTLVGFAFYFSRYTRPYALIGLTSFAGATVTVLGIDCFSRAGLKEFWVYIWNVNDQIFPAGVYTYPLTKGIRVEIAVIVVLTVAGVISQLKLWRVVQEHRAKRAEARAEEQKKREEEEENIGRQIEEDNARERRQWEMVYGNQPPASSTGTGDSGVGDMENEKKNRVSHTTVQRVSSNGSAIEMANLPASDMATSPEIPSQTTNGLMVANKSKDSKVIIRVSPEDGEDGDDEGTPMPEADEKLWLVGGDGEARPLSTLSAQDSQRYSRTSAPVITPLPFTVPDIHDDELDRDDDRSSFATFADEDDRSMTLDKRASRGSLANRLSVGSGNLLRSLSQHSHISQVSKRKSGELVLPKGGESTEDLVSQKRRPSDAESMAATVDGMSLDGSDHVGHAKGGESRWSREIMAEFADTSSKGEPTAQSKPTTYGKHLDVRPYSTAETIATDILNSSTLGESAGSKSKRSSTTNGVGKTEVSHDNGNPTDTLGTEARSEGSKDQKSVARSVASGSGSLTKDRLPSGLSRVALSYRTNEWAKHLSVAEAPEPENIQLNEHPEKQKVVEQEKEASVSVNVDELQQTPATGIAPTIKRSPSSMSNVPPVAAPVHRSTSTTSLQPPSSNGPLSALQIPPHEAPNSSARSSPVQAVSPNPLSTSHSARMKARRLSSDKYIQPIQEENGVADLSTRQSPPLEDRGDSAPSLGPPSPVGIDPRRASRTSITGIVSYSSPQTLLGKREMFLRSKSQSMLFAPPIPEGSEVPPRPVSQIDSSLRYSMSSPYTSQDPDDLPLSQRKELMRQSSMLSVRSNAANAANARPVSSMSFAQAPGPSPSPSPVQPVGADGTHFNSHQPQRHSTLPSQLQREAQMASFRQSVAAELRAGTPVAPSGNNGRETPLQHFGSMASLVGNIGPLNGNNDVQRSIDQQRNMLLSQREQEAQRRELERWEKERSDRAFEERMRRGDLAGAHRDAMRKMQHRVKDR
ncbi:Uu.00g059680.m01.CDS01 [Anthostomella pinea]|uniref:Uu.00g059680.m01.CDS01 n=1 Tax=Anthostomella pinea TaxID=933095 RepID=A0AAI8YM94_9PEZI|nr:Uu.00g059680.m01.CDS01 [Anthostomella pinea]